jgi:periplasmic copper chaperone A
MHIGRHRRRAAGLVVAGGLLAFVTVACGDDDDTAPAATTTADADVLAIEGAWARSSPAMADAGAAYLTIVSPTDDRLSGVAVDPTVAARAELHETSGGHGDMGSGDMGSGDMGSGDMGSGDMGSGDMGSGDMGGEMTMREVEAIELPGGQTVVLEPGGLHVMLLGLTAPLEVGTTFDLTLTFESAGERTVAVEVRENAP